MKVALYARVSTNKEQTTENQVIRLKAYAEQQGFDYDLFEEVMSTRKTRPVKADLMAKVRSGVYAAVAIYKLDRFARSSTELVLDVKQILDKGVKFISLSDNLDFSTATGKLHFHILSAFAEFERELIRERTIEGLNRAKSQGKSLGRPKGSKDIKSRRKSGYIMRHAKERKQLADAKGNYLPIDNFV